MINKHCQYNESHSVPACLHSFVALSRGPGCLQAPLTGRDPEDKEREEAEAEREEAEGHREPQAPGQRARGPAESCVCCRTVSKARRS